MENSPWSKALAKVGLEDPFEPGRTAPHMRTALRKAAPYLDAKVDPLKEVRDLSLPGPGGDIPARFYKPFNAVSPSPCTLFVHGGGYIIGDLDTHDLLCRRLAVKSGTCVLAIDYRLAPEHPFPAACDDALAAFDWLRENGAETLDIDPDRLAVAGDSAGGGLAAMLGQQRRAHLRFQLLIYPLMQLVEPRKAKPKALEGHMLSATALEQIISAYVPGREAASDKRVSPLLEDELTGMPQAYIAAAELDPLFDEGQAYRDRLRASGVKVDYKLGKALPHGYFNLTAIFPGAKKLVDKAAYALGEALRAD